MRRLILIGTGALLLLIGINALDALKGPVSSKEVFFAKEIRMANRQSEADLSQEPFLLSPRKGTAPSVLRGQANFDEWSAYILNSKAPADRRREVLHRLTTLDRRAVPALTRIAHQPIPSFSNAQNPHSADSAAYTFEKGLRITAIEALDQWALKGENVLQQLISIRERQSERDLAFLANLAIAGIQEGQPGKVTRFIEKMFDEVVNEK